MRSDVRAALQRATLTPAQMHGTPAITYANVVAGVLEHLPGGAGLIDAVLDGLFAGERIGRAPARSCGPHITPDVLTDDHQLYPVGPCEEHLGSIRHEYLRVGQIPVRRARPFPGPARVTLRADDQPQHRSVERAIAVLRGTTRPAASSVSHLSHYLVIGEDGRMDDVEHAGQPV